MQCICEKLAGEEVELDPICLGHFWIFQNLKAEELSSFMKSAVRKKLAQGESLFLQGYPAREMFLIKGGRVKLTKLLENGTELTLDILKAADFVGENILSEEALYHINAWCMESTLVCG